jgi:large subunit ribosomal protein L7/L12
METEADLTRRILELERRMDLLFDHLKVEGPRLVPQGGVLGPEVRTLLERGDKLAAVALVREQTGMGLAEAKRTVEQMVGGS